MGAVIGGMNAAAAVGAVVGTAIGEEGTVVGNCTSGRYREINRSAFLLLVLPVPELGLASRLLRNLLEETSPRSQRYLLRTGPKVWGIEVSNDARRCLGRGR